VDSIVTKRGFRTQEMGPMWTVLSRYGLMIKGGLDVNSVVMAKGFQVMKTVFSEESVVLCQSSHQRDVVIVNSVVMGRASGHEDCV
jgi:hypothetical protein